jgi:hypothetical protein
MESARSSAHTLADLVHSAVSLEVAPCKSNCWLDIYLTRVASRVGNCFVNLNDLHALGLRSSLPHALSVVSYLLFIKYLQVVSSRGPHTSNHSFIINKPSSIILLIRHVDR